MHEKLEHQAVSWIKRLGQETGAFDVISAERGAPVERVDCGPARIIDVRVQISAPGGRRLRPLLVEVKSRVTPQVALSIFGQMQGWSDRAVPLLCSPRLSPRLRELCKEHGISYLDGAGNCRIAAPGLYVERRGLGTVREERPSTDVFAVKTSRIARALLSRPGNGWQVQQLAQWASPGVSLGLASKAKRALIEQGFAVERDRLLHVRSPDDLLNAWAAGYRMNADCIPLYVAGDPPQAEAAIAQWCLSHGIRYALTQFSGVWRAAPAVRYQRSTVCVEPVEEEAWRNLAQFNHARRVESGANVVLWQTYDPAVFLGERLLGDPPLNTVSALQLYLDLKQLQGRGDEAARAVYDAEIAPVFAAAAGNLPDASGEKPLGESDESN
jgi:hypothetical protein